MSRGPALVVGLTGGIASGKSTVAALLAGHGAIVIDADVLAREVVAPGTPGLAAIAQRFGPEILTATGELNRAVLAGLVFGDEVARADVEAITHPAVAAAFEAALAAAPEGSVVVYDVPLLVENGLADRFDLVVVTEASAEERVRRAVVNRGMSPEAVRARIAAQASDAQRRAVADVVIDTDHPLGKVRDAVAHLWRTTILPLRETRVV